MVRITSGEFHIDVMLDGLPNLYGDICSHASLVEEFDLRSQDGQTFFVSVGRHDEPALVVVAQRFSPTTDHGVHPGVYLIPETGVLLVGAGERLLAYDLTAPRRLWDDFVWCGFWGWSRWNDVIIMEGELEMAAFDLTGRRLWTRSVEPPWWFTVEEATIHLTIEGVESSHFPLVTGPQSH